MPPKKRASSKPHSSARSKRLKFDSFAIANETDGLPQAHVVAQQQAGPSSAGVSARPPRNITAIPTLVSLAARVFATHFKTLYIPEGDYIIQRGASTRRRLKELPDTIIPGLLALLRQHSPNYLSSDVLITYFLRGREICLPGELPGVNAKVISAIGRQPDSGTITTLDLSRLARINDGGFAKAVSNLPGLEKLVLRGCGKAGPLVLGAVAAHCPRLQVLNMNYTVATPQSILSVLLACSELQVLKIAGIPKLIPGCVTSVIKSYKEDNTLSDLSPTFPTLRSLKLRLTNLNDTDLAILFSRCPNLTTLDISFTSIKHIPLDSPFPQLTKLSLTSTPIPASNLVHVLTRCPTLETLYLGALGDSVPSTSKGAGMSVGAGTLTDSVLRNVTNALERCENIKHVNLVGNLKLGSGGSVGRPLQDFMRRVGRRCEILNFENVPQLRSSDLEPLLRSSDEDLSSPLRVLNIARTAVNGDSAMYIAACTKLEILNVAGTRFGKEELFVILDNCPDITELDLTGCRSVSVQDRRRFFEVWEASREGPESS